VDIFVRNDGLAVSVSLCFAQGDRNAPQELQRVQPFACDSLDPKVCLDIYQRRMEQPAERTPDNKASPGGKFGQVTDAFGNPRGKVFLPLSPKELQEGTRMK
jgi:hypothetical protein